MEHTYYCAYCDKELTDKWQPCCGEVGHSYPLLKKPFSAYLDEANKEQGKKTEEREGERRDA